jgi:hypothetical protein
VNDMKAKIATAVSVIAVLGAGSAAALVNTQILDSGPTESGASKAVLPPASTVVLSVPSVTDPIDVETMRVTAPAGDGSASSSSTTSTTPASTSSPTTSIAATGASGLLTSFNVGEAGVVTVDVVDGQLVLVSAEPKPGWTVTKAEDDSNDDSDEQENEVEVEFLSADVRVEFEAEFVDGRIVPKVESESTRRTAGPTGSAGPAPSPVSTTITDDRDDSDDSDDDHDDSDDRDRDDEPDDHDDEPDHDEPDDHDDEPDHDEPDDHDDD